MNDGDQATAAIQEQTLRLLETFDAVCRREGLRYFIAGGTLLGAIRHGGFIPWDDDADLAMPRDDYRKLERVLISSPPPGTYWESVSNADHFPTNHFFGKLCLSETEIIDSHPSEDGGCHHFGIDVFPLDIRPAARVLRLKQAFLSYFYRHLSSLLFGGTSSRQRVVKRVLKAVLKPFYRTVEDVARKFDGVCALGGAVPTDAYVSLCGRYGYRHETFLVRWFRTSVPVRFGRLTLPAPEGWEPMLEATYGADWRTPPALPQGNVHYRIAR